MTQMTDDQIRDAAYTLYGSDNVDFDTDARISRSDEGHAWVQAWVYVPRGPHACFTDIKGD